MIYTLILIVNILAFVYVILVDCIYLIQLVSSSISLSSYIRYLHYSDHQRFFNSHNTIPISVLVPAYNEAATILDNVKNLTKLDFPEYEVIVINDGSKDNTLQLLKENFNLIAVKQPFKLSLPTQNVRAIYRSTEYANLVVIDKDNGGKADALNAGINISRYPVFVSLDADSILEKQSLMRIILPFVKDHRVVGVGGIVRIASGCKIVDGDLTDIGLSRRPLVNFQTVEYLRAFLTGRLGFDAMGMLLIISGAFGAFKKQEVIEVGGYSSDCVGEDMELVMKLHQSLRQRRVPYQIKFLPDPVCWTQPPERFQDLRSQRRRWQVGLINSLMRHKEMLFNPTYGRIGLVCLPYYLIFELIGPVLELAGYIMVPIAYLLGVININFFFGFYAVSVLYGIVLSIGALLLEENTFRKYPSISQLFKLMLYAIVDNFGYRQLNTIFRVEALFTYNKQKHAWGQIKRRSFVDSAEHTEQLEKEHYHEDAV